MTLTRFNADTTVKYDVMNNMSTEIDDKITILNTNKLAKTDVVNTTTQVASDGKALNAVQLNPDVDGTMAQQINDLKNNCVLYGDSFGRVISDSYGYYNEENIWFNMLCENKSIRSTDRSVS